MAKKDDESNSEQERRFSQEQYDMLLRCSEKKDVTEWNEWRKKHPEEEILLEGAELWSGIFVQGGICYEWAQGFGLLGGRVVLSEFADGSFCQQR